MTKPILVTGATGKQGGALINALLASPQASDFLLLAVTRSPESSSAWNLTEKGVKVIKGDLNDVPAIFKAAEEAAGQPIWGVFSAQAAHGVAAGIEETQGKSLVDGALEHGVKMFVYSSVDRGGEPKSWETKTEITHFITKYNIEHHLRDNAGDKMMWTILRPTAFMDNWNVGMMPRIFATIWKITNPNPLQLVATKDIGIFGSIVFLDPEKYNHKAFGLAGDEITYKQACDIYKEKTGRDLPESYQFLAQGVLTMLSEVRIMFNWFKDDGYKADIQSLKEMHPELLSWGDWLAKESSHEMK